MFLFFFSISTFSQPLQDSKSIVQEKIVENFENFDLNKIKVFSKDDILPEYRISKFLTSPLKISESSFMIRILDEASSFHVQWKKPYEIEGYIENFEFQIYSNNTGGNIFLFLVDTHGIQHKIIIVRLDFKGWKSVLVPIEGKIDQNDWVINKDIKSQFLGFFYEPPKNINKEKEKLVVIDDISVKVRKKYKINQAKIQELVK
ncbi:MAG: hypothetical protein H7A23_01655 [Leptospiraceae bacterium]|nr:hypothetical protein [Leptospiraceae bacterium]MCP5493238.1 hypothetical protein [Leptospiraceae bacterium]